MENVSPPSATSVRFPFPVSHFPRLQAGNGTRTRDPNLGKVVLYQLSYSRARTSINHSCDMFNEGGGEGNRTPDLVNAIHALSQLSYAPLRGDNRAFRQQSQSIVLPYDGVKKRGLA